MLNPIEYWNRAHISIKKRIQELVFPESLQYNAVGDFGTNLNDIKLGESYLLIELVVSEKTTNSALNPTLVVLASAMPNTLDAEQRRSHLRQSHPPTFRSRITVAMRRDVVELYVSGVSAVNVAERFGIGKATVLRILRQEGAVVRAQGRRIT